MMYYVYLLKSLKDEKLYIGYTNNLRKRLAEHNRRYSFSTKSRLPLKLIYYEAFLSDIDAREREKKLKYFGRTNRHLIDRLKNSLNT